MIIEGAQYKIQFHSENNFPFQQTSGFDVIRTIGDSSTIIVAGADTSMLGSDRPSPPFDGMVAFIDNDTLVKIIYSQSGWLTGHSNLDFRPQPNTKSRGLPAAADYEVRFYDHVTDTTIFDDLPINFEVWNLTGGYQADVFINDYDASGSLTVGDKITVVEYLAGERKYAWDIRYYAPKDGSDPVEPEPGDVYRFRTTKPFYQDDYFAFSTKAARMDENKLKNELDKIAVVPNPYIAAASWERKNRYQSGRGERKIDFIHLPPVCTIRIYTVSGALVKTIYHNNALQDGSHSWNLVSEDGMDIAYGLYIYHVDVPGMGSHIGKFAVVK